MNGSAWSFPSIRRSGRYIYERKVFRQLRLIVKSSSAILTSVCRELGFGEFGHKQGAVISNYKPEPGDLTYGALISVTDRYTNVIFARYIGRIGAFAPNDAHKRRLMATSRRATFTSLQQKWCVG